MFHLHLLGGETDEPSGSRQLGGQGHMVGRDTRLSWTQEAYRGLYGYRQDLECGALTVRSH